MMPMVFLMWPDEAAGLLCSLWLSCHLSMSVSSCFLSIFPLSGPSKFVLLRCFCALRLSFMAETQGGSSARSG